MRPAMCEVFRRSNGEKTGDLRHGVTQIGNRLTKIFFYFRMTGTQRCVLPFGDSFELRVRLEERQRHRSWFIEIEIYADSILLRALNQSPQVRHALLIPLAEFG